MAIYHLRLKVISRSLGRAARPGGATRRSVVAAAAYRSGERLFDSSQGKWFEFDKPDVIHTEILAPANAPDWVFDRQALWNMVDRSEKRVDAQLAREVEITLPRELNKEQQVELVHDFVQEHGLATRTVKRAKEQLDIRSTYVRTDGERQSYWLLPGQQLPAHVPPEAVEPSASEWLKQVICFDNTNPLDQL